MAKIWIQLTHIGGCSSIHRDWYTHQIRSFHIKPMAMGWFPKLAVSGCFSAVSLDLGPPLTTGFLPNMSVSFCFGVGGPNPKKPSLTHWMWLQSFFFAQPGFPPLAMSQWSVASARCGPSNTVETSRAVSVLRSPTTMIITKSWEGDTWKNAGLQVKV